MTNLKSIIEEHYNSCSVDDMWDVVEILDEFLCSVKKIHPREVEDLLKDIEDEISPSLTEKEAKEYVAEMLNEDGTRGGHWTPDDVFQASKQKGIDFEEGHFNKWDLYYIVNMIYSDHYRTTKGDANLIFDMALETLNDKDFPKGKKSYAKWYAEAKEKLEDCE